MAVPTEYQSAVDYLRKYGSASTMDVFDGVTYWTDDQLYELLNEAIVFRTIGLHPVNKACTKFKHNLPFAYWLRESSVELTGTSLTPTYDPETRTFEFASPISAQVYLSASYFHMNVALANLWEIKANQRYKLITVKGGANQLFMEQEYNHCVSRAQYYRDRTIKRFKR